MFDHEKAKQLQKQSHVRGMLSKQFFSNEQNQLQKKRRQMKRILDQQVQERRRLKQKEKIQSEKKQKIQEQLIQKYHVEVLERDRRLSENNSNLHDQQKNHKNHKKQLTAIDPKESRLRQNLKQRANSKSTLQDIDPADLPLLPIMAFSDGPYHNYGQANNISLNYNSYDFDRQNAGNIPLLDLSEESNFLKNKKKSKVQVKKQKQKTDRENISNNQGSALTALKFQDSRNTYSHNHNASQNQNNSVENRHERKKTFSDQDNTSLVHNIMNSRVSKASKYQENFINRSPSKTKRHTEMQIPQEIQQIQNQNKLLKSELKKNQQAISLLIGAVRSNAKLDKFRVQAEKILRSNENQSKVTQAAQEKRQESPLLLPKLKVKHQSIMHDYLIEAAKKARLKNIRNQTQIK